MDLDFLCAKKYYGRNRRASMQGQRKKNSCKKPMKFPDQVVKATRFAFKNKEILEMNDLIKGLKLEDSVPEGMAANPYRNQKVEFDEGELLGELARLKNDLNESRSKARRHDDRVHPSPPLFSASPSTPGIREEDEVEDELEYLRRWASESL